MADEISALSSTTNPPLAANTASVRPLATALGALVQLPFAIPEATWNGTGNKLDTTDLTVAVARAAGVRNYVTAVQVQNTSATASRVVIKDGAAVLVTINCPASMPNPAVIEFPTPLRGTAATAVNIACLTTATDTLINAQGYFGP